MTITHSAYSVANSQRITHLPRNVIMASSAIAKRGILITGATGKQGGATIDALISEGALKEYILLGVTRDATSAGAKGLESRGVRVVQGDFSDCKSLFENAKTALGRDGSKIHGVFSVQVSLIFIVARSLCILLRAKNSPPCCRLPIKTKKCKANPSLMLPWPITSATLCTPPSIVAAHCDRQRIPPTCLILQASTILRGT